VSARRRGAAATHPVGGHLRLKLAQETAGGFVCHHRSRAAAAAAVAVTAAGRQVPRLARRPAGGFAAGADVRDDLRLRFTAPCDPPRPADGVGLGIGTALVGVGVPNLRDARRPRQNRSEVPCSSRPGGAAGPTSISRCDHPTSTSGRDTCVAQSCPARFSEHPCDFPLLHQIRDLRPSGVLHAPQVDRWRTSGAVGADQRQQ